jgi:ADP-heptose:LPS heptosyltransferase
MEQVKRILIIKPSWLGDVVNALPFLAPLPYNSVHRGSITRFTAAAAFEREEEG